MRFSIAFLFLSFLLLLSVQAIAVFGQSNCTISAYGQSIDISFLAQIPDIIATTVNECDSQNGYSYATAMCRAVSSISDARCNVMNSNFCQVECLSGIDCPAPMNNPVTLTQFSNYSLLLDEEGDPIGVSMVGYNTPSENDKMGLISVICPNSTHAPKYPVGSSTQYPLGSYKCNGHSVTFAHPLACNIIPSKDRHLIKRMPHMFYNDLLKKHGIKPKQI